MSGPSALDPPSRGGLLGILPPWLRRRPIASTPAPAPLGHAVGEPDPCSRGTTRVLVVDDDPVNLLVVAAQMERTGLLPMLAADGAEAVALACELPFDLILMDLQMPILDGLKATAAIRRFEDSYSRTAVPVIAYSSLPPGKDVLAAHGINGSLAKPCDERELLDCLVRWCPTYRTGPMAQGAHGSPLSGWTRIAIPARSR